MRTHQAGCSCAGVPVAEHGNVLWDLVSFLDDDLRQKIRDLGGLSGIATSHPHYYCNMADWAEAFGCPIHLPASDKEWVMQPSERIRFWEGTPWLAGCWGLAVCWLPAGSVQR